MVDFVDEQMARRKAVQTLRTFVPKLDGVLGVMYDLAPGYAGEVESVKEAVETAMKVLNGEPVD